MIVKLLFEFVTFLISLIPFNLPTFPEKIFDILSQFKSYLLSGIGFIKAYTDWNYILLLFKLFLSMTVVFYGYKFFMWIIKKIPTLNIK